MLQREVGGRQMKTVGATRPSSRTSTTVARRFASFAADLDSDSLPSDVAHAAALVCADTIGAILAGSVEQEIAVLTSRVARSDGVTILAAGMPRAETTWAALINATAGVANELDEWHPPSGHPGAHVVPAVLAVAEERGLGWREVLVAVTAGYEVAARLGMCTRLRRGFHPHGTIGSAAAALACATLLRLPVDKIEHAVNIAASMWPVTPYEACYQGATARNVFAGEGARLGVTAAVLAECGFTAGRDELSASLRRVSSSTSVKTARPLADGSFRVMHSATKFHAACARAHASLDAVRDAVGAARFTPRDVNQVRLFVNERSMSMDVRYPRTRLAAKFSIPYGAAVLLRYGESGYAAYSEARLSDHDVGLIQQKVVLEPDATLSLGQARAVVETTDAVLEGACQSPLGWPPNRTSDTAVMAKVEQLLDVALPPPAARALAFDLARLESLRSTVGDTWRSVAQHSTGE